MSKEKNKKSVDETVTNKTLVEKKEVEVKVFKKPTLRTGESHHYTQVWFNKGLVEEHTGKTGSLFYTVNIDDFRIIFGTKAFICESKDGTKMGFHVQNSREYRIFGTSEAVKGKELIQYNIQLNQFNKQQKEQK